MKNVIIKSIILSNWKGQNRTVYFGENENYISGRNASGKTTLLKAWQWLLTGYSDANTPKNADLYDNTKELSKDTPKASVRAIISLDGAVHDLQRTATAKFVRRRGTDLYEKASSDEYEFFVDDIKYTATEFDNWVSANIADVNLLKYALSGDFFIGQVFDDKKKARQIIERIVGNVSDEDMTGDYPIINELKDNYTIQQIDEQAANRIKDINESLNAVPTAIRLQEEDISRLKEVDIAAAEKEIEALEKESKSIDRQLFDISERVKPLLEAKHNAETARTMKQEVYDKARQTYEKSWIERDNDLVREISEMERRESSNAKERKDVNSLIEMHEREIERREKRNDILRERVIEIKSQTSFECPLCGSALTGDKLENARREAYDKVVAEGKENAELINQLKAQLDGLKTQLNEVSNALPINELKEKLAELRSQDILPFEQTEQGMALQADIDAVEIPEVVIPDNRDLQDRKEAIQGQLKSLYAKLGTNQMIEDRERKIAELREQQKHLGEELGLYELQRIEVKKYRQEQMQILSQRVNGSLNHSSIDIWSTQKDGSIIPDLVLKNADGINYSTANNASRIVTAVDIQRFFCDKLGVNMPTWVDECAVLNSYNLPKFDSVQMLYLFCSDNELKIESN